MSVLCGVFCCCFSCLFACFHPKLKCIICQLLLLQHFASYNINCFPMNTKEVLLGNRTETTAEYCSSCNEGFLLALGVLIVEIAFVC